MANEEQLAILRQGVEVWNKWRKEYPNVEVDLRKANLRGADLMEASLLRADLMEADLSVANLGRANLRIANLSRTNLRQANLIRADLGGANLSGADLREAYLFEAELSGADLSEANLSEANLIHAALRGANLSRADLRRADLIHADLMEASLISAELTGANLSHVNLVKADVTNTNVTNCNVYAVNVWDLVGEFKEQKDLIVTPKSQSTVTVDNIEVAQFIYLLLNNQKIRNVIDTVTTKTVLILGRFTEERKQILDALRDALRKRGYIPILFDFQPSLRRDLTETVQLLANMAKFIIADITEAKSIPQELSHIIPFLPSVPVQPILLFSSQEYGMFEHWRGFNSVLPEFLYENGQHLIDNLDEFPPRSYV